ncbi:MAG: energy transducer TonB [Lacunisphaera sp.]|nr:energy transducer TonB [Lacunisphaera sp.]
MNKKSIVLAAAILGLLSSSAFATTTAAHHQAAAAASKFEAPVVTKVVSPTGLASRYKGETLELTFTVSADGKTHNIGLLHVSDEQLTQSMIAAVSQWEFTPGRRNGTPVSTRVVLPIELVERS